MNSKATRTRLIAISTESVPSSHGRRAQPGKDPRQILGPVADRVDDEEDRHQEHDQGVGVDERGEARRREVEKQELPPVVPEPAKVVLAA